MKTITKLLIPLFTALSLYAAPIERLDPGFVGDNYTFCVFGDTRTDADSVVDGDAVTFRLARNEVFRGVNSELKQGNADFSLFTGDMIWMGGMKKYWYSPGEYLEENERQLIFPIPGNHETWGDTTLHNYFSFFPQLKHNHSYYFVRGNSLFISLCSGGLIGEYSQKASFEQDQKFTCTKATFEQLQLETFLKERQQEMKLSGDTLKNIFMQYHKPSYSHYKHPPLNEKNDPVEILKTFSKENSAVQMYVFNGHNHTTEMYQPAENITVIVAGGGGAPQKVLTPKLIWDNNKVDESLKFPPAKVIGIYDKKGVEEIFWKSLEMTTWDRTEHINYWMVSVNADSVTVTEKVLTYNNDASLFIDGLTMKDGKVVTR